MAIDLSKPLLRLEAGEALPRRKKAPNGGPPKPPSFSLAAQNAAFGPKFRRLESILSRDENGLELRRDPAALAPERLLVFELRGSIASFAKAIKKVPGLELIDEEELDPDERDAAPTLYLLVPNGIALKEIASLWRRWRAKKPLPRGFTPWRDVFATLRDLRSWNAQDRLIDEERDMIADEIAGIPDDASVRVEVELVFREAADKAQEAEDIFREAVARAAGSVVDRCRIPEIAYHTLLTEFPKSEILNILARQPATIAGLDPVMHIRPQSVASGIEPADAAQSDLAPLVQTGQRSPIVALLDGVPVAQHPLLAGIINLDDQFDLEPATQVSDRIHGTAMASLIIHGDRNAPGETISRRIHCVPVLGSADRFPDDRLVIDLVYQAVMRMRQGEEPFAPNVLIINLSLGNRRKPFYGRLSPWARLLDRLAHQLGLLFLVSAGNHDQAFSIPAFRSLAEFEDAQPLDRSKATIEALGQLVGRRKLLSPSETVNGLTIGAANSDAVTFADRRMARTNVDPFSNIEMANASSALGPGFAGSVKPDVLLPGAKEHLRLVAAGDILSVRPTSGLRAHGLKVAAPPQNGVGTWEHYTCGTSAATALASRLGHQIHDALEIAYEQNFLSLPHAQRAVLIKALIVHTAAWPEPTAELIKNILGPADNKRHAEQRDNIRRFLGYGFADPDAAIACVDDRATFWAVGQLSREKQVTIDVPIPVCINGQALPHSLSATLAWFTPILPNRQSYRAVRLTLGEPSFLDRLRLDNAKAQPDQNQIRRGTVLSRRWTGIKAPAIEDEQIVTISVQREPDQGLPVDEDVPFGVAITFSMPGAVQIYEQALARVTLRPRVPARP